MAVFPDEAMKRAGLTKRPAVNETLHFSRYVGRWGLALSSIYEGDRYGHIGSDTWSWRIRLTRDPR